MQLVLPETPPDDIEFDLDVRLQPVARHVAAEKPAPSEGCGTGPSGCAQCVGPPAY
jgi:hypothetical protein